MENQSFVFAEYAGRLNGHDETLTDIIPERDKTIISELEPKRKLAYYVNRFLEPTSNLPVFYGAHVNKQNEIAFTVKFPDSKCYSMVPSRRKKGILPFLKDTKTLNNRCMKKSLDGKGCPAKFLSTWKLEVSILENFTDIEVILDMGKSLLRYFFTVFYSFFLQFCNLIFYLYPNLYI